MFQPNLLEEAERAFEGKNYVLAFNRYRQAADLDDPKALSMVGQYYHLGYKNAHGNLIVRKNIQTALNYYNRAARAGDSIVLNNIRMIELQEKQQQRNNPNP